MLYSNVQKKIVLKSFPFGELLGIVLGEDGRGRKEIFIPVRFTGVEKDADLFTEGISHGLYENSHLGLGVSRSGRPIIVSSDVQTSDGIILSSYNGYTRRGNGYIDQVEGGQLLVTGIGADGDAGRIGNWEESLFIPTSTFKCHIRLSGGKVSNPMGADYWVLTINGMVFYVREEDIPFLMDNVNG